MQPLPARTPAAPLRPLLLIGLAVALAHGLVLQHPSIHWAWTAPALQRTPHTFTVRTVAASASHADAVRTSIAPESTAQNTRAVKDAQSASATSTTTSSLSSASSSSALSTLPAPTASPTIATSNAQLPGDLLVPTPVRLHYTVQGRVRMLSYNAQATLLWRHDGQTYDAHLSSGGQLLGTREQSSQGLITANGLAPLRFADKLRSEVAVHFERDKATISFSANTPAAPLQDGAQDALSVLVQLAALAAGNPARLQAGSTVDLQVASAREADVWHFVVEGEDTVSTAAGEMAAIRLWRAPRKTYDAALTLWLAPALGYWPARIRWAQMNGDVVEQVFSRQEEPAAL